MFALLTQSILRQAKFKGAKLLGASFFDADLTGVSSCYVRIHDCSLVTIWFCVVRIANLESMKHLNNVIL